MGTIYLLSPWCPERAVRFKPYPYRSPLRKGRGGFVAAIVHWFKPHPYPSPLRKGRGGFVATIVHWFKPQPRCPPTILASQ